MHNCLAVRFVYNNIYCLWLTWELTWDLFLLALFLHLVKFALPWIMNIWLYFILRNNIVQDAVQLKGTDRKNRGYPDRKIDICHRWFSRSIAIVPCRQVIFEKVRWCFAVVSLFNRVRFVSILMNARVFTSCNILRVVVFGGLIVILNANRNNSLVHALSERQAVTRQHPLIIDEVTWFLVHTSARSWTWIAYFNRISQ